MSKLLLALSSLATLIVLSSAKGNVVCYFTGWTIYRLDDAHFEVDNIDPNLCTHILYAFITVNNNLQIVYHDAYEAITKGEVLKLMHLRQKNPSLKILASMGGFNAGSGIFSNIASDPLSRKTFADNVAQFINVNNFDGFDFDWEYPSKRDGSRREDKANYILLLKELRATLGGKLLTAAVSAGHDTIDVSYDVPNMNKYLDQIFVMAYDFHGEWDRRLGHNAPLYAAKSDTDKLYNVEAAIKYWINKGASPRKLNLGLGTYGRSFTMSGGNPNINAPAAGPGIAGPYTKQAGMLGYNEICKLYNNWQYVWDNEQKVPHRYSGDQWVGYDDTRSIRMKAEFAKKMGLAGVMFWSLDTDDFRGKCGQGDYPLIRAAKLVL